MCSCAHDIFGANLETKIFYGTENGANGNENVVESNGGGRIDLLRSMDGVEDFLGVEKRSNGRKLERVEKGGSGVNLGGF